MTMKEEKVEKTDTFTGGCTELCQDVSNEVGRCLREVKHELEWLEQNCQEMIRACESERDLRALVNVKTRLATIAEELRRESYSLSHSLRRVPLILGEVGQEQLGL